jgi:ribonuclease E
MLINAIDPEENRIAVVEDGVLQELHVELANREAYLGNIYKGKVINIEPSIGAAFVSFGGRMNGFLHVSDVLPAYGRPEFVLTDVIEGKARVNVDDGPASVQAALADDEDDGDGDHQAGAPGSGDAPSEGGGNGGEGQGQDIEQVGGTVDAEVVDVSRDRHRSDADHGDAHHGDASHGDASHGDASHGDADRRDADHGDAGDRPFAMAATRAADPGHGDDEGHDLEGQDSEGRAEPQREGRDSFGSSEAGDGDDRQADDRQDDDDGGGDPAAPAPAEPAADGATAVVEPRRGRRRRGGRSRDGREVRDADERRRNRPSIEQLLKRGQEVVVQVTKEGIGTKGPTLSTYVSLPGRCLVLMPSLPKCGVSRKIEDARERRRLKRIVRELDETGQGGIGFIVRTAGVQKSKADLERDRDYLNKIWEMVAQRVNVTRAPAVLYQESDLVLKAMRDLFTPDIAEVVVDSEDVFLRIKDFADKLMPHMADRIRLHAMTTPLFHSFGIEKDVEALFQQKIDTASGSSIVIDQTEALVAIDVNSGKFRPGSDLEETAYRTNLEAIPDIVRQLRLRDLGGLIIIDFIDMAAEKHRRGVEKRLIESLRGDRSRIKVGRISPFGMLEITRQRVGPGLKRTVFTQCAHCKGSGWSRTVQSKALSVLREVRALLNLKGYSVLQVFAAPPVNDYLVNYKRRPVLDLEDAVGKTIMFRPEASYPIDVVHYRFLTGDGQEARVAIPAGLGVKA